MSREEKVWLVIRRTIPLLVCAALASAAGTAQTMRRQSVPLAVDIERSLLRSSMFLQFEARWYGLPLDKFTVTKRDESESACAAVLEDIRTQNYAAFKNIWDIPPKPAASANEPSSGVQVGDAKDWLDGYHSAFDFEHVTMVAEVLVGSHSLCVWDANAKSGAVRRAFIVRSGQGHSRVSAVTSDTKLEEVILNSLEAARRFPDLYKPVFDFHPRFQYAFPSEGRASGEHPVFLQFDGMPLDYDLSRSTGSIPPNPVVEFYQRAYLASRANNMDTFASMFTLRSAAALKQWMGKEKDQPAAHVEGAYLGQRYIKFVMSGDPVSLVFVSGVAGKAWKPEFLSHRYVVKDSVSGKLALANLAYANAFDQLLDSDLFDKRILGMPEPKAKPGAVPSKPKTTS